MKTVVFVRPVEGYAEKLILDDVIAKHRHNLDCWSFSRGLYVSHSVFGSLHSGFSEFVSVTARREDPALFVPALDQANQTIVAAQQLTGTYTSALRPRGFSRLLVANQNFDKHKLPIGSYEPLQNWGQMIRRTVTDPPVITTTEPVTEGQLSILGRLWPLHAENLREYVSVRLLEHILGSTEDSAALRPLRDSGETYAAVGRYIYDLGVLVVAVLAAFIAPLEVGVQRLLDSVRPTTQQLQAAKRDFWFQFSLSQSTSNLHAFAPFALLDPSVSMAGLRSLVDAIRLDDVTDILVSSWAPVRKAVDEHGLV